MVSNGFLPLWVEAKQTCPAVCQSCVITTLPNPLAILLMTGTPARRPSPQGRRRAKAVLPIDHQQHRRIIGLDCGRCPKPI
jgi:hypothetical protein